MLIHSARKVTLFFRITQTFSKKNQNLPKITHLFPTTQHYTTLHHTTQHYTTPIPLCPLPLVKGGAWVASANVFFVVVLQRIKQFYVIFVR